MGVPAFFRWLSRKYPSIVVHCIEERVSDDHASIICVCVCARACVFVFFFIMFQVKIQCNVVLMSLV